MTAPAPTIQNNSTPIRQTANSAQNAGALFALSGAEGALFADLLSIVGALPGIRAPGQQHAEQTAGVQGEAPRAAEEESSGDEEDCAAESASDEGPEGTDGPVDRVDAASGLPMTIHTLNHLLLKGNTAKPAAQASDSGAGARASRQLAGSGNGGDEAARAALDEPGTQASTTTPEKVKDAAPSPLAVLTRAGETAQTSALAAKTPTDTSSASQGPIVAAEGAKATGAMTTIAVAAPGAAAAARDARPTGSGAPAPILGIHGAQGPRGGVRSLRSIDAPLTRPSTHARAEAFQAQIARGLAAAVESGRGTMTLRLKPEALGQVQIKVSMKDGVLNARFEAQTREARDLLLSTCGELRRSLEAAGLSVERIEASVAPELREQPLGEPTTNGAAPDASAEGHADGSPGRNDSGSHSGRRGTDAASTDQPDDAAEPLTESAEWLVLGLDTVA